MEASEPKWVNPILNIIWVNSFKLGGLQILLGSDTLFIIETSKPLTKKWRKPKGNA